MSEAKRNPPARREGAMTRDLLILCDLNRQLRRVRLLLACFPTSNAKPWTAAYRWEQRMRKPMEDEAAKLEKRIAAHRRKTGIVKPKEFRPRLTTEADRRIARQYSDVKATRGMFRGLASGRKG